MPVRHGCVTARACWSAVNSAPSRNCSPPARWRWSHPRIGSRRLPSKLRVSALVLTRCGHLGTVQAQWTQRNVSMRSMIWVATGLLVFGLASAQDALISDPDSDAVNDAEQTQAYRALLHDAARQVTSDRKSTRLHSSH